MYHHYISMHHYHNSMYYHHISMHHLYASSSHLYCRVSLGSESRMYKFPSGNFLVVKLKVVITSRKVGQADSTPTELPRYDNMAEIHVRLRNHARPSTKIYKYK